MAKVPCLKVLAMDVAAGDMYLDAGRPRLVEQVVITYVGGRPVAMIVCAKMRGRERWFGKRGTTIVRILDRSST